MQILGHFCFILIVCSVIELYNKILDYFLGFFLMDSITCLKHLNLKADFGCGFLLFGSLGQVFKVLGLFFLFRIGLRFLQIGWYCNGFSKFLSDFSAKSGGLRKGLCSKSDLDVKYNSKVASCKFKLLKFSKNFSTPLIDKMDETKDNITIVNGVGGDDVDVDGKAKTSLDAEFNNSDDVEEEGEQECYDEDEEFDVLALRKLIKIERRRGNSARLELEKERMAAASAAEEAMAMILRLQNEKSLVEMEANQFKRLAEEKQHHDQEVIQSLQWLLLKHESERSHLDDQLGLCRQKLKLSTQSDEGDNSEGVEVSLCSSNAHFEDAHNHGLFSSLDMDLSPW